MIVVSVTNEDEKQGSHRYIGQRMVQWTKTVKNFLDMSLVRYAQSAVVQESTTASATVLTT